MRGKLILMACCISIMYCPAMAEDNWSKTLGQAAAGGKTIRSITPVFSQLVMFSFQPGFKPVFQNTHGGSYIQEAVPNGETVDRWTQMITLTGARGMLPTQTPIHNVPWDNSGGIKRAYAIFFGDPALKDALAL